MPSRMQLQARSGSVLWRVRSTLGTCGTMETPPSRCIVVLRVAAQLLCHANFVSPGASSRLSRFRALQQTGQGARPVGGWLTVWLSPLTALSDWPSCLYVCHPASALPALGCSLSHRALGCVAGVCGPATWVMAMIVGTLSGFEFGDLNSERCYGTSAYSRALTQSKFACFRNVNGSVAQPPEAF